MCQGYFGEEDKDAKKITESQLLIGRLLFIFQLGMNFNQHGNLAAHTRRQLLKDIISRYIRG